MSYSITQRVLIIKTYWECQSHMPTTIQKLEQLWQDVEDAVVPSPYIIRRLVATFSSTGTVFMSIEAIHGNGHHVNGGHNGNQNGDGEDGAHGGDEDDSSDDGILVNVGNPLAG